MSKFIQAKIIEIEEEVKNLSTSEGLRGPGENDVIIF